MRRANAMLMSDLHSRVSHTYGLHVCLGILSLIMINKPHCFAQKIDTSDHIAALNQTIRDNLH